MLRWRQVRSLCIAAALLLTLWIPSIALAQDEAPVPPRFTHGDLVTLHIAGESTEVKGTFWLQPVGESGAPMPITLTIEKTHQESDGLLSAQDVTLAGPAAVAPGIKANYTFTVKRELPMGIHRLSLIAQAPGGYHRKLELQVIVLELEAPIKAGAGWEFPLQVPASLANLTATSPAGGEATVTPSWTKALGQDSGTATLKLQVTNAKQPAEPPAPKKYTIPLTLTLNGEGRSADDPTLLVRHLDLPVQVGGTVTPPKDGYKVQYAKPFPVWWIYNVRNWTHKPVPVTEVTLVEKTPLYDAGRHRILPAGQLQLLRSGGDSVGPAFVAVEGLKEPLLLSLAVRPTEAFIAPGSYTGKVEINGQSVDVTVEVRHSITLLLLLVLLLFFVPNLLAWFKAQLDQADHWRRLLRVAEKFRVKKVQPRLVDNLLTWTIIDLVRRLPPEESLKKVLLAEQLVTGPWDGWLEKLKSIEPKTRGFWRALRQAFVAIDWSVEPSKIDEAVKQVLKEAKVPAPKINELSAPEALVIESLDGYLAPAFDIAELQLLLRRLTAWCRTRFGLIIQNGIGSLGQFLIVWTFARADKMWQFAMSAGALVTVLWQAYSQFGQSATFGANPLKDYGAVIATTLGVKAAKSIIDQIAERLKGKVP